MDRKEDKTRRLLRELDAIEKKSEAMRRETERLRKMKNDAKHALAGRYPDLFGNKANFDTMSKHKLIIPTSHQILEKMTFSKLAISNFISILMAESKEKKKKSNLMSPQQPKCTVWNFWLC